jgi:hypothetical protein
LDALGQVAGLSAQVFLFFGQTSHMAAACRAALDARLGFDQAIDLPEIRLMPGDF